MTVPLASEDERHMITDIIFFSKRSDIGSQRRSCFSSNPPAVG